MRCIARVGGGTYVDADDTEKLREELLAAFARAFRDYVPGGTPVEGGPDLGSAPRLGEGLYQGELRAGAPQTFSVELAAARAAVRGRDADRPGGSRRRRDGTASPCSTADGEELDFEQRGFDSRDTVSGLADTLAMRLAPVGLDADLPPGVYGVQLTAEGRDIGGRTVPFELAVEALEPDARPGRVREPGPEPEPAGAGPGRDAHADPDAGCRTVRRGG